MVGYKNTSLPLNWCWKKSVLYQLRFKNAKKRLASNHCDISSAMFDKLRTFLNDDILNAVFVICCFCYECCYCMPVLWYVTLLWILLNCQWFDMLFLLWMLYNFWVMFWTIVLHCLVPLYTRQLLRSYLSVRQPGRYRL